MRSIAARLAVVLVCMAAGVGHGQTADAPAEPAKPKVYALIAAIGDEFTTVSEYRQQVGTHIAPYRRTTEKIPDNLLNRLALHGLDRAIGAIDPASNRIYMSLPAAQVDRVTPAKRDSAAITVVTAELAKMPQRMSGRSGESTRTKFPNGPQIPSNSVEGDGVLAAPPQSATLVLSALHTEIRHGST